MTCTYLIEISTLKNSLKIVIKMLNINKLKHYL